MIRSVEVQRSVENRFSPVQTKYQQGFAASAESVELILSSLYRRINK